MDDHLFGLMANPNKVKYTNNYKKMNYLEMYLQNKFDNLDTKSIKYLYNHIDKYIDNIDIDKVVIITILEGIIDECIN